jgi:EAL domain-containing protein (putative c-di-GMP-specific phosphodiesterase class I)
MVPPKDFIEVAEREGLLPMLTDMMLGDSLQACAGWRAEGADINVAVNLSPTALHDASLTHRIEQKLRLHRVPPGALTLEVTEGSAIPDTARATETLTRLRIWGVNLAVDDFGTGHSSLLALARMPFNELKIDQAFVTSSASNPESLKIVSAIASLGQALGLQVVAEGMETAVVAALMRDAGCGVGQGWHYGRAVTAATFTAMLTAGSSKAMRGALPVGAV